MEKMSLLAMNLFFVLLFWGVSVWMYQNRNRPVKIHAVFPLVVKYRKERLHPVLRDRSEIVWFSLFMFLVGCLFFVSLILNIFS